MLLRRRLATVLSAVLVTGLVALPAFAQDAPEGFSGEQCEEAVAAVLAGEETDVSFIIPDGVGTVEEYLAALDAAGVSLEEICSIYILGGVLPASQDFILSDPIAECVGIVPFLRLTPIIPFETEEVTLSFVDLSGDEQPNAADLGTYEGTDTDGNEVTGIIRSQTVIDTSEVEEGQVFDILWPGMELDDDGEPIKWPGWDPVLNDAGETIGWEQVDDGFNWARTEVVGDLGVFAEFNPETDLSFVTYPPPTSDCADPEQTEVEGVQLISQPAPSGEEPAVLGRQLARTGLDAALLIFGGLALLGLGVVSVMRTRPARQR